VDGFLVSELDHARVEKKEEKVSTCSRNPNAVPIARTYRVHDSEVDSPPEVDHVGLRHVLDAMLVGDDCKNAGTKSAAVVRRL
jgi:hypothetical protein